MNGLQQQQQQQQQKQSVSPTIVANDCLAGGDICNINGNLEPPTIDNISKALVALYTSNDSCMRDYAQQWLIKIQSLHSAWDFCPQLLETNVLELQFFGASTLEQKLKNEWTSLPNEMKQLNEIEWHCRDKDVCRSEYCGDVHILDALEFTD
ncbi:hypothetical protein PPL_11202 [Heterostelium album PN500]|uniref:Importin N-terminal domain-containing protein n=1 Tax=Heterostelium pallidum (strain ATCC 26659 / Pp 5 / PN500) TaxID=670386 RepID=D3BTU2_HETP5|nr:hypothetical protein PPL_11202 [Heterostelium album PN500]EFA75128.1 hypothetical protein PPL_11202 [Heterostelium album PN500]|eukprot:XP_020427262.1 hypothetical protein PPL_11202 [Heterostelium album PN500]